MKRIVEIIKWWYWSGRYTKIKLFDKDSIGVDEGYFECSHAHLDVKMQYYKDLKAMDHKEAGRLLTLRSEKVIKKYFGPKYIKC